LDLFLRGWSPDSRYLAATDPRGDVADAFIGDTLAGTVGGIEPNATIADYVAAQLGHSVSPLGWTRDRRLAVFVTAYPYVQ